MTAYREEFAAPELRGKVVVHHDHGDPGKSLDLWPVLEKPKGTHLYCCGPKGLMDAVRDMTGHWPTSAVHFEDFGAGKTARTADDKPFVVRLGEDGEPIDVPANVSILEALRAQGHRIPSSCESGTCGTCRMKLLAGEADHRDLVLTDTERLSEIMVCVSRAHSPELVVDRVSATRRSLTAYSASPGSAAAFMLMLPTFTATSARRARRRVRSAGRGAARSSSANSAGAAHATRRSAVRGPRRRCGLHRDAAPAPRGARRSRRRGSGKHVAGREADGDHARRMRGDDRGRARARASLRRRPQPQLRCAVPARARS